MINNKFNSQPKLVKLYAKYNSSGSNTYYIEDGFKYMDMLIVGGGGNGYFGGGGSGVILYAPNCIISLFDNMKFQYYIAFDGNSDTRDTHVIINKQQYYIRGGSYGGSVKGGNGGIIAENDFLSIQQFMKDPTLIAACSCGGGSGSKSENAGSGSTISGNGEDGDYEYPGYGPSIKDGYGGYKGGIDGYGYGSFGIGYKLNNNIIPIVSIFGASGRAGNGSREGGGGGAAGYADGGEGGGTRYNPSTGSYDYIFGGHGYYGGGGGGGAYLTNGSPRNGVGGEGIIVIYYHN